MLHIILAILKVIGIILLVILGIVLALVLLILFVPVRYDAHLVKEDEPLHAEGRFGWLFHLAGGDFCYQDKKAEIRLKLLGKVLKTFHIPKGMEETAESETLPQPEKTAESETPPQPEKAAESETPPQPEKAAEHETPRRPEKAAEKRSRRSGRAGGRGRMKQALRNAADKVRLLGDKIWNLAMRALEAPSDIGDRIDGLADGTDRKIRKLSEKAGPFVSEDAFAFYGRALRYLGKFFNSCRFRRFEGYLLAGTGEPDRTGELIGFLYLVLPQASGNYEIQPDFYQKVFRTDTRLKGHVRLNHALMLLLRLLKDKEFRRLLRVIRHKKDRRKTASGKRRNRKRKLR